MKKGYITPKYVVRLYQGENNEFVGIVTADGKMALRKKVHAHIKRYGLAKTIRGKCVNTKEDFLFIPATGPKPKKK